MYDTMMRTLKNVDLTKVVELQDNTSLNENLACGAGGCEI